MSEHDSYRPSQADMDARRLAICPRLAELRRKTGSIDRATEERLMRLPANLREMELASL